MRKCKIELTKSISVMLCLLLIFSTVPAMAYTNGPIPENSCGAGNHTYAGRTYDSSGHWTNYCVVCGKPTSGYDPSYSGGGSYANGTPKVTSCSHDYVVQSRSYLGNGMHSYTSKCRYCGGTIAGSTACSIIETPTPNTSRDHKITSKCQYCGGVSATRYESCTWNSKNECPKCHQKATGRSCSNGVCKDGSATYDPCGCTNFGAAGGCALSLVITWNKQGQNANASIGIGSGTCAWHANNISYVHIANVFHDTIIDCTSESKHTRKVVAHAEGSANCSKCAGGHTTSSDFTISEESGWKTDYVTGWQQNNASTHKRTVQEKCQFCGATRNRKTETESHSFTTSSSTSGWEYNSSSHWKTKTKTSTCSVCGYVKRETSRVNEGSHSFTVSYSSWTAGGDGYYHRTKTSSCYCGYTKTSDERGERVHNHVWVSTSGSWYDYDSTRHTRNNWEYCNGTPTPCGETRSLGNSYESHNSSGQRTDNDLSGWLYDDNHNDRHDDNETHHWKEQQANSKRYCTVCGHIMDVTRLGTTIVQKATHTIVTLPSDRSGYRKLGCSVCGYYYYEPIEYTVEFDGNLGVITGNGTTNTTIKYNQTVALPYVTREGYTFVGWQPYSGVMTYTCSTNTDPSNGTVKLPAGTSLKNLTTADHNTVKFVAIWKHVNPVITKDIRFNGTYVYSTTPLSSYPVYYLKGDSPYTPVTDFTIKTPSYTDTDYFRVTDGGTTYDKNNGLSYMVTNVGGDYKKTESFGNGAITVRGDSGTSKVLTASWKYTDKWRDKYITKNDSVTDSESYELVFDREAPHLDTSGSVDFKALYENSGKNVEVLNGKTSHYIVRDVPVAGGNLFVGINPTKTTIKVTNRKNSAERSLTGTPHYDAYGRCDYIDFGSVTVNTSENLFKNGFSVEMHFEDRLGNAVDITDNFGDLQIKITDIGSYTDRESRTHFRLGEAVYVTATIMGGADSVQALFTPAMSPQSAFRESPYASVVGTIHSEDLNTVNVMYMSTQNMTEITYVFLIPERKEDASAGYNLTLVAEKSGVSRQDSVYMTVDREHSVHDGVHTIIVNQ